MEKVKSPVLGVFTFLNHTTCIARDGLRLVVATSSNLLLIRIIIIICIVFLFSKLT